MNFSRIFKASLMSEDNKDQNPKEERPAAKKPAVPVQKRNTAVNPFNNKNNKFISSKTGNPGSKGMGKKGGSMKKGK